LASAVQELFDATFSELDVTINYQPASESPIPSIIDYVEQNRIQLWDTAFSYEFDGKGVHKNHSPELHVGLDQAVARVFYKYFRFVLYARMPQRRCRRSSPTSWTDAPTTT